MAHMAAFAESNARSSGWNDAQRVQGPRQLKVFLLGLYKKLQGLIGFKDPRTQISGLQVPNIIQIVGFWALKPHYLSPWRLRTVMSLSVTTQFLECLLSGNWGSLGRGSSIATPVGSTAVNN